MPGDFDLVKDRVDIVALVGERLPLRRTGRTYKGLCPFHNEKTPSFTVDPERRTYKCFGCGQGGDAFDWVMHWEGLDKSEALRLLAERAGVTLAVRSRDEDTWLKRLYAAHETALFYFRQALRGTDRGREAQSYLAARGLTPETVEKFALGYAPDDRQGLVGYLRKKGFDDREMTASGLVVTSDRGTADRFSERLMIPTRDARGRVIAFGGRAMRADQRAKYINSPQTPLFTKGATLFALDVARPGIRRAGEAVIVEGYFDAIACHQAGFDNVVASQGTALTVEQYRALDGLRIDRAVVAFDADAAGAASAERRGRELVAVVRQARVGSVSVRAGLGVYVAILPEGDPDLLARTDPERLRAALASAQPVLEHVIERVAARHPGTGPDAHRRLLDELLPLLTQEPDPVTREVYLGRLSVMTGVDHRELARLAAGQGRPVTAITLPGATRVTEQAAEQPDGIERYLMAQLVRSPEEAVGLDLAPDDLAVPEHRAIFEHLRDKRSTTDLPADLAAVAGALAATGSGSAEAGDADRAIGIAAMRLRERNLRRRLGDARGRVARATERDRAALDDEVARLAEELDAVMKRQQRSTVLRAEMESE